MRYLLLMVASFDSAGVGWRSHFREIVIELRRFPFLLKVLTLASNLTTRGCIAEDPGY
jgi:hypothetical protein